MADKKDLVLGAIGGLGWESVEVWAFSLATCGYAGPAVMIVYDDNQTVIDKLRTMGVRVITVPLRGPMMIQRFRDFHDVLQPLLADLRYCVITDVRDVYFQTDPMAWLEQNLTKPFVAVSEGIRYRNAQWNRDNMAKSFPDLAGRMSEACVYCAGVMAGEARAVADFALAIHLVAKSSGYPMADQAGYNLLLSTEPYASACQFAASEDGFACQAGTFVALADNHRSHLLEPPPVFDEEGIKTAGGRLYAIAHQYDRIASWREGVRRTINERWAKRH